MMAFTKKGGEKQKSRVFMKEKGPGKLSVIRLFRSCG